MSPWSIFGYLLFVQAMMNFTIQEEEFPVKGDKLAELMVRTIRCLYMGSAYSRICSASDYFDPLLKCVHLSAEPGQQVSKTDVKKFYDRVLDTENHKRVSPFHTDVFNPLLVLVKSGIPSSELHGEWQNVLLSVALKQKLADYQYF
ncbi:hypothetical protein RF11_10294 [Thelohanellus kitauei]|uniref:Uncharacterized protein n=1 Tax=Thelohanellus kitauei TaxID=669202 RepID=A0A0C2MKA6_THEKT|nr:hypothetical protein RF11_10294 [Thelohanellus kitauei]